MPVATTASLPASRAEVPIAAAHRRRLTEVWRSAGWPCHDPIELDLLAAGLLERQRDAAGRETVHLTDRGIGVLSAARRVNQRARNPHEALIDRTAEVLAREGRWVWRGLALWAALPGPTQDEEPGARDGAGSPGLFDDADAPMAWPDGRPGSGPRAAWVRCLPDLFSIRPSSRLDRLDPQVHEIKAHRSDLLSDLRRPAKGAAYVAVAGSCTYVLAEGIGDVGDVPEPFGVWRVDGDRLALCRAPIREPCAMALPTWLALARAAPCAIGDEPWQWPLTAAAPGPEDVPIHAAAASEVDADGRPRTGEHGCTDR
jgi:hypothetical protein